MTLHLKKLAVGITDMSHMEQAQTARYGDSDVVYAHSRNHPKRKDELIGGSLYWIIKGRYALRQEIVGFADNPQPPDEDGNPVRPHCIIILAKPIIPVQTLSHHAFQGWRYLNSADAPADLTVRHSDFSESMESNLNDLGII